MFINELRFIFGWFWFFLIMFIHELRFIFNFLQNFVGMTVQITFTFYFSRRLNINFIFGSGWCFTFITECTVTYESVWSSLIPTFLPKLVVETDCDQTILWKDPLECLTPPIWCSFYFSKNLSGSVYYVYFVDQNP